MLSILSGGVDYGFGSCPLLTALLFLPASDHFTPDTLIVGPSRPGFIAGSSRHVSIVHEE
jgi:hypothetical protein